jgi:hypothetical protein
VSISENISLFSHLLTVSIEQSYGLRAILVEDSSMSYTQLLAGGYDVVVCSYEFFETNGRERHMYYNKIRDQANRSGNALPRRPTTCLHSDMMKILNLPWRIVTLDEAQRVNKRGKIRHESLIKGLYATGVLVLSGTLAHSKWHDISGYWHFSTGHPLQHIISFYTPLHRLTPTTKSSTHRSQRYENFRCFCRPSPLSALHLYSS